MRRPRPCHDKSVIESLIGDDRRGAIFLLYDLKIDYDNTEFFTLGEGVPSGLMALWHESPSKAYAHVLTDNKDDLAYALRFLTDRDEKIVCLVRTNSDEVIKTVRPKGRKIYHMDICKGKEKLHFVRHKAVRLGCEHEAAVEKILALSGKDPNTISYILGSLETCLHFGSFKNNVLCSYARVAINYGGSALLDNIYTVPEYRRQGMAETTVGTLIEHLFYKDGFTDAHVLVDSKNYAALGLYNKLGFKRVGELTKIVI